VFTSLWPVRTEPAQRRALSRAVEALAAMLRTVTGDRDALDRAEAEFYDQISRARQYAVPVWFERTHSERGSILTVVQGLFIPIHAIVRTPAPATASPAARAALSSANAGVSGWLHAFATVVASNAPAPPLPLQDPAIATLERVATDEDETAATRAHVHQQLEWLELLHAQCVDLAERGPT
ncbi:MAG TPA: hypothetical protein VF488_12410, partial [Gemmatimonadaceae bacterium]